MPISGSPPGGLNPPYGPIEPPGAPGWPSPGGRWGGWRGPLTDTGQPAAPGTPPGTSKYPPARTSPTGLPHFKGPFTLGANGKPIVAEQDSAEDVASCVYNILVCPQGAKHSDAEFGLPSPLFGSVPLDTGEVIAAVQQFEPRADLSIQEVADVLGAAIRDVTVAVGVADTTLRQSGS